MHTATYTRYELLRTFRSTKFFLFSLGFPLLLYILIASPNKDQDIGGISFPLYYMTSMASWGTMTAVVAGGARIAAERMVGWNRQLRITPLPARTYIRAKVVTGYAMAALSIALLYLAGILLGVHLPAAAWVRLTALILVGLAPFAALGVAMGHQLTTDAMGPALGGATSLFALFGGVWGPIADHGALHVFSTALPSYWLVQSGPSALGGGVWPLRGWLVIAAWTVVMVGVAMLAYRRDTQRV